MPENDAPVPYVYRKGDRCRILGNFRIQHIDCDEWGDGTVTDVRTGRKVTPP